MFVNQSKQSILVLIYLTSLVVLSLNYVTSEDSAGGVNYNCSRLKETCKNTTDCCVGCCIAENCHDGLFGKDRSLGTDVGEAIAEELSTGLDINVSDHPNIGYLPSFLDCGFSTVTTLKSNARRKKRIVGGDAVEVGAYPWMVQVYLNNISFGNQYFHCGGTLINNRTILTAAHCLTRIPTATTLKSVTIGNIDRRQSVECDLENVTCTNSTHYGVDETVVHELYSEGNVRNDLGLIRLNRDVVYTDFIRPICLPKSEDVFHYFEDGKLSVIGWGTQNKASDSNPKVISWKEQEVENNLVARENCNRFYSRVTGKLARSQLCAGGYPGKGDCRGDSGGPLFKKVPIDGNDTTVRRYFIFGIVSTGAVVECGKQGRPSVYTSVMFYMKWILDNIVKRPKIEICANCTIPTRVKAPQELATGLDIDVRFFTKANLLPKFPDCGPPPEILPNVIATPNSPTITNPDAHVRVKRVVGGRPFGLGSLAWMAQIYTRNSVTLELHLRCSGFIVSSRYVMTAAHCVTEIPAPFALDSIVLGNYNRLQAKECLGTECYDRKFIPIEDVFVHEYFAKYTHEYDIALIRLPEEIKFSKFLQPICLPMVEDTINGWTDSRFTIAGWGRVSDHDSEGADTDEVSNILHAVNITLQSRKACDFVYSRQTGVLDESRLCGGGEAGKGECFGDDGGPMMRWISGPGDDGTNSTRRYYAFGITSFASCGEQGIPGIYTNILYHMPWVLRRLEE